MMSPSLTRTTRDWRRRGDRPGGRGRRARPDCRRTVGRELKRERYGYAASADSDDPCCRLRPNFRAPPPPRNARPANRPLPHFGDGRPRAEGGRVRWDNRLHPSSVVRRRILPSPDSRIKSPRERNRTCSRSPRRASTRVKLLAEGGRPAGRPWRAVTVCVALVATNAGDDQCVHVKRAATKSQSQLH
jgi:hypothetical protein